VLAGFSPLGGVIVATGLLYALIRISQRPEPLGRGNPRSWLWGVPITLIAAITIALAVWSSWHGLFDHAVLPPPAVGGST
jgi:hypothetical protein